MLGKTSRTELLPWLSVPVLVWAASSIHGPPHPETWCWNPSLWKPALGLFAVDVNHSPRLLQVKFPKNSN